MVLCSTGFGLILVPRLLTGLLTWCGTCAASGRRRVQGGCGGGTRVGGYRVGTGTGVYGYGYWVLLDPSWPCCLSTPRDPPGPAASVLLGTLLGPSWDPPGDSPGTLLVTPLDTPGLTSLEPCLPWPDLPRALPPLARPPWTHGPVQTPVTPVLLEYSGNPAEYPKGILLVIPEGFTGFWSSIPWWVITSLLTFICV